MLVDTHCHLDFEAFEGDLSEVVARARQMDVRQLVNPGVDLATSRKAVALAERYPEVYAAVGVHPNDALTWNETSLTELRSLAHHPKVVALGEIGLDNYHEDAPRIVQVQVLEQQLSLAAELGLPVIVHTRNRSETDRQAMGDILAVLTSWQAGLVKAGSQLAGRPGVLHSFSGNLAEAHKAVELNLFLGITGPITFRNSQTLQEVVTALPLEHLVVETDAPFLAPHPYRGKRNEPSYVRWTAEKIAQLKAVPLEAVAEVTTRNAGRLFRWRVNP